MHQSYFAGYAYHYADPMVDRKTYLAYYKQYLLYLRDNVAEYAKQIEEALSVIDHEQAKLKKN